MKVLGVFAFGAFFIVAFGYVMIFGMPSGFQVEPTSPDEQLASDYLSQNEGTTQVSRGESFAGTGSVESLYVRNQSLECQVSYTPSPLEDTVTGTMFMAAGQVRADFVVPAPDLVGQAVASVIYDGATLYLWTEIDGELFGAKQPQSMFAGFGQSAAAIDYNTLVQYSCQNWLVVDETLFNPPTSILFTNISTAPANMEFGTVYEDDGGELPL